ncbi:DEAD/DEAH box helicase [Aquisalinus flavus]|uniref:DEAD-box ATP-dependent RNA helicase RhpA n=1 Tax=Aquisalinus flavus TaxID=1526572 RepID=A0A8J2Y7T8_9PROT|nr:DEAD/DEAH box helicase [Aquisalinus flavus]MBD0426630.1 DEAD/DEAH box helicase [Aquisalinus flavus]UNE47826.1 DEAD/DEAH box helicase [Aquisalinus flavus]GGD06333.1 DEAD/DEAH box helicase [Aquisalinus flavus]
MRFEDLGLEPKILKALAEAGYETPTPIQEKAIPEALAGRDVLGIAQTGTGKTAGFTLPMIHRLSKGRSKARMPRSLVLCPTRELAAQVAESFEKYGKYHKLSMALLIGGVSFTEQDMKLTRGVDVLIATPGRLIDHFERGKLLLTGVEVMVVDEADRMLDMGFIPDIEKIFKLTPFTRQTLFFSATMPAEIQRITDQFLSAPARIEVSRPATTAETITQKIVRVPARDDKLKRAALRKLIDNDDVQNGIVFCNRKTNVDIVAKSLQRHGYDARPIHGDLAQSFRTETLDMFRAGKLKLLIASDVAARGLDVPAVSHVFNFDVPIHADDYVHRIGRTGRAGRPGAAFMLVTPADSKAYESVLKTIGADAIEEADFGDFFEQNQPERKPRGASRKGPARDTTPRDTTPRDTPPRDTTPRDTSAKDATQDKPDDKEEKTARPSRKRAARTSDEPAKSTEAPARKASSDDQTDQNSSGGTVASAEDTGKRTPSRGRSKKKGDDDSVVGMGDHTPAFLLRAAF